MLTPAVHPIEDPTAAVDRVLDGLQRFCPPGLLVQIHMLLTDAVATHPVAVNLVRGEPADGPPSDVMSTPGCPATWCFRRSRRCCEGPTERMCDGNAVMCCPEQRGVAPDLCGSVETPFLS